MKKRLVKKLIKQNKKYLIQEKYIKRYYLFFAKKYVSKEFRNKLNKYLSDIILYWETNMYWNNIKVETRYWFNTYTNSQFIINWIQNEIKRMVR